MPDVRPSPLAGQWYPGQAQRLTQSVDAYLQEAAVPQLPGQVMGLIAPHAGHRYSGAVAGQAFAAVQGRTVETVAVVGPMHQPFAGRVLTTGHDAYQTPLGAVEVDAAGLAAVEEACTVPLTKVRYDPEHSVEIELPFLQRALGSFKLIPLMMRDDSAATCAAVGGALAKALAGRNYLLVASSDLSHFYPQRIAGQLDSYMLAQIETFDPQAVLKAEDDQKGFACGRAAIAAVLTAARQLGGQGVKVVAHATSGDVTGEKESVVGYGAALIWK